MGAISKYQPRSNWLYREVTDFFTNLLDFAGNLMGFTKKFFILISNNYFVNINTSGYSY